MAQTITHRGTVKSVDGKHISVEIAQASACSACVAKKLCNSSESKDKLVGLHCPVAAAGGRAVGGRGFGQRAFGGPVGVGGAGRLLRALVFEPGAFDEEILIYY